MGADHHYHNDLGIWSKYVRKTVNGLRVQFGTQCAVIISMHCIKNELVLSTKVLTLCWRSVVEGEKYNISAVKGEWKRVKDEVQEPFLSYLLCKFHQLNYSKAKNTLKIRQEKTGLRRQQTKASQVSEDTLLILYQSIIFHLYHPISV